MTDYRERADWTAAEIGRAIEVIGAKEPPSDVISLAMHAKRMQNAAADVIEREFAAVAAEERAVWRERLERLAGELEESPPFWRHAIEVFSGYDREREVGKRIAARLRALGSGQ